MKRLFAALIALFCASAFGITYTPISTLNPGGSTSGQFITSSGPTTAPAWTTATLSGLGGTVAIANGGTGAVTQAAALTALLGSSTVPVLNGGTGVTTAAAELSRIGAASVAQATTALAATGGSITGVPISGASGSFTTLAASSNDALTYTETAGQAIPSGSNTVITGWVKTSDRVNANFNASTGVFTAPATAVYQVSGQVFYAASTSTIGNSFQAVVVANGVTICVGFEFSQLATSVQHVANVSCVVAMTSGQTLTLDASQNSGSSVAAGGASGSTYLSINRIP